MRRAALVACLMLSAACAVRSAPVAPPATVDEAARLAPRDRLDTALTQIFQAPALEHANWGIKIESLRTGETL